MYSSIDGIDIFNYVRKIVSSERFSNYVKTGKSNYFFEYNFCNKMPFNEYEILSKMIYENTINSFKLNESKCVRVICWAVDKGGKILSKGISDNTVSTRNDPFYSIHKELKHNGRHAEMEMIFGLRAKHNNTEYTHRIDIPNDLDINMGRIKKAEDIDEKAFKNLKYINTKHIFLDKDKEVDSILIARLSKRSNLSDREKRSGWNFRTTYLNSSEPCAACELNLRSYFAGKDVKLVYKKDNGEWITRVL